MKGGHLCHIINVCFSDAAIPNKKKDILVGWTCITPLLSALGGGWHAYFLRKGEFACAGSPFYARSWSGMHLKTHPRHFASLRKSVSKRDIMHSSQEEISVWVM